MGRINPAELIFGDAPTVMLAGNIPLADYFEEVVRSGRDAKLANNWIRVELLAQLNKDNISIENSPVTADQLGDIISKITDKSISGKIAKTVFEALWKGETNSADEYIEKQGLTQVSDSSSLAPLIDKIISENPKQAEQFRAGKTKLMGFFVGQVMKETQGKANPQQVNEILNEKLG